MMARQLRVCTKALSLFFAMFTFQLLKSLWSFSKMHTTLFVTVPHYHTLISHATSMKSPLKVVQSISISGVGPLRPIKFNEEELDVLFANSFSKPAGCHGTEKSPQDDDYDDSFTTSQLQEWNIFASFDPINDSLSSSSPLLRSKQVNFATDENGQVLCTEYDCVKTRQEVRETWYGASDFRQFRAWCHETAACAVLDMDYCDHFHMLYSACSRNTRDSNNSSIPTVDADDAMEYANYRGLERVIFRKELQTDKIAAIQGVVWTQNDAMMATSEDKLADTSCKLTVAARNMAQYLAAADAVIAQQSTSPDNIEQRRRFIEI
jgi:hypothetical protein